MHDLESRMTRVEERASSAQKNVGSLGKSIDKAQKQLAEVGQGGKVNRCMGGKGGATGRGEGLV